MIGAIAKTEDKPYGLTGGGRRERTWRDRATGAGAWRNDDMARPRTHRFLERPEVGTILDSIAGGVLTVNSDFIITSFNRAAERITGFSAEEAVGEHCNSIFRAPFPEEEDFLAESMQSGRQHVGVEFTILNRQNEEVPVSATTAALRDKLGNIIGGVETFRDLTTVETLRREMHRRYNMQDMVSKHHRMQEIFALIPDVAPTTATVLILGETGTGKELLAKAVHAESLRRDGPFVKVNCGALPDSLLESELFGHIAGAFTDAHKPRKGRFELARGGTIFLDEVGDTSPALQFKLLRVLQEGKFEPVGSSRTRSTDVRIIAATNRDLKALIAAGDFREDLYYRINTVVLTVPPLRERREDIPILVQHFIQRFNHLMGKALQVVAEDAMRALLTYDWPGNIRELEHAIEHAFVLQKGTAITLHDLPDEVIEVNKRRGKLVWKSGRGTLADIEGQMLAAALERHHWNRSETCRELGISRTTLWRKMRGLGLIDE